MKLYFWMAFPEILAPFWFFFIFIVTIEFDITIFE